jgi:arginyl-tRNA synthetase
MSDWLSERLQRIAEDTVQRALAEVGLTEIDDLRLSPPKEEAMGDLGMPCHAFARVMRKNPTIIAQEIAALIPQDEWIASVEALNGYVNIRFDRPKLICEAIQETLQAGTLLGTVDDHCGKDLLIEFSSPNTNKPQHLGHVRNNVLGLVLSNLHEAVGYRVVRANIINDRGIHICKSMLAYQLWGQGQTPESTGRKGDFFVGDFYVKFEQKFSEEYEAYRQAHPEDPIDKDRYFNETSELGKAAQDLLCQWEDGSPQVRELWAKMNRWVYDGFDLTYERMGLAFDWIDYESDTYLLGKKVVDEGLERGIFNQRGDGAVVCDLAKIGIGGEKILLRSDGTSVYMTQDLGTAMRRIAQFDPERLIYVVADEQNYHFEVLFGLLELLQTGLSQRCFHLSYGMVDLPHGRMKSREGTVVDADSLMDELCEMALSKVREQFPELDEHQSWLRAEKIGQAGLKFFMLKFTPQARMRFDPEQSIAFEGETGPYCLYSYARINSIAAKLIDAAPDLSTVTLCTLGSDLEYAIGKHLISFPVIVREATAEMNPSLLTRYLYQLAKSFSSFYQDREHRIIDAPSPLREARMSLAFAVQAVLKKGLALLGIETIEQM